MKMPPLTLVLAACLGLCLAATACGEGYGTETSGSQPRQDAARQDQATNNVTPTASATVPALSRDALRSAEYAAGFPTFGTLQRDRIGAQDPLAFGDLNGDGVDDAAVLLLLVNGNAGHRYLAAVLNESGSPKHVSSAFLGLNIGIDSVTIADGVVTLQTKQLGPNDPNCCPTKEVVVTFRLTDNAWQLLAETPLGSVTSNFRPRVSTPAPAPTDAALIVAALQELRSTEVGETVAAWFLESGGGVTFDDAPFQDLPVVPEIPIAIALDLQENRIVIGTAHRGESAETLAARMAGSMTQSISLTLDGEPRSTAACYDMIQLAYQARAAVWYEFHGSEGKPNANSQEAFLNRNMQRAMSGILADWVRGISFYRQLCVQFAAPTSATPTIVPAPIPPTPIPAPSPTPTPHAPAAPESCLTPAEFDFVRAFDTDFWNSTRSRRNAWFAAANAAAAAYSGLNDIPTGNTELRLVRLANQAIEALRLYGLAVHEAILALPSPPSVQTAELHRHAVQHYKSIEVEYLGLLERLDRPRWMQARILPQQLSRIGDGTFEEILDVAAQIDALAAKGRCQ